MGPSSEHIRSHAARVWLFRARAEAIAAARFHQLSRDLAAHGAPDTIIDMARTAAEEETRHIALCMGLAEHLGAPPAPLPEVPHLPSPPPGNRSDITLLIQLVATGCINETVSAAVLNHMLRASPPGRVHDTIREILQDEVGHSRIGWAYLAHEAAKRDVRPLGSLLPRMLGDAITAELFAGPLDQDPDADAADLGTVPRAARMALFATAVTDLIIPGLAQHGIDTAPAMDWLDEQRASAAGPQVDGRV